MPSLLCLLTDTVKTHPPCLGQSHVPKNARFLLVLVRQSSYVRATACVISVLFCARHTSMLSSPCLGPIVRPSGEPPCHLLFPKSFSSGRVACIYRGRNWGKDLPERNGLCSNRGGKRRQTAPRHPRNTHQCHGLRPVCSETPTFLSN